MYSIGMQKTADILAHEYTAFNSIIKDVYKLDSQYSAKERNLHYTELYGSEYFDSLLNYLLTQQGE